MGESDRLAHELLALKIVVVGDKGEGVKDECGQLGVIVDFTAFSVFVPGRSRIIEPVRIVLTLSCFGIRVTT